MGLNPEIINFGLLIPERKALTLHKVSNKIPFIERQKEKEDSMDSSVSLRFWELLIGTEPEGPSMKAQRIVQIPSVGKFHQYLDL